MPPVIISSRGLAPASHETRAALPSIETGMCHVIVRVMSSHTRPMVMASAPTSPIDPFILPMPSAVQSTTPLPTTCPDVLRLASIVAPVTPSMPFCISGHVVIAAGNDSSRNTRPTRAGFQILQPRPPKDILPMPIDTTAPITTIHHGSMLGRLNASSMPVISAEPLPSVHVRVHHP